MVAGVETVDHPAAGGDESRSRQRALAPGAAADPPPRPLELAAEFRAP
jgi:hypothetical protein